MIGIKCERGSHRFFKRYGEKFEDSEGKQIFLEFADEERTHLELLIREYRRSSSASGGAGQARPKRKPRHAEPAPTIVPQPAAPRDRPPPPHDRVGRHAAAGRSRRAARPAPG